jgi:hypothetical protein
VFDMVGNVEEWVVDWADLDNTDNGCTNATTAFGFPAGDAVCFGGNSRVCQPADLPLRAAVDAELAGAGLEPLLAYEPRWHVWRGPCRTSPRGRYFFLTTWAENDAS